MKMVRCPIRDGTWLVHATLGATNIVPFMSCALEGVIVGRIWIVRGGRMGCGQYGDGFCG